MCEQGELVWMENLGPHGRYVDECMVDVINAIIAQGFTTLACCCGHGKYEQTVVVMDTALDAPIDFHTCQPLLDRNGIGRKRLFYKMDEDGMYYLPEVENNVI